MMAAAVLIAGSHFVSAQPTTSMRFQGMDRNNDGRISRAEWNGSDQSFKVHDWNGDGILSGEEVRSGGRRTPQDGDPEPADGGVFTDWTVRGFNRLDRDRDNRITVDEWRFARDDFRRADHDGDGVITRAEFLNEDADQGVDPDDRFVSLDVNRDNRISRREWKGKQGAFDLLDDNRDGMLTRAELGDMEPRTPAYQAGHDRGLIEGRAAGREDRERNQGWDLEGQRELEQADSGYVTGLGSRADYQAGYRAAFRVAYQEGYGPRYPAGVPPRPER
jgi:Ca2+-binding EF-hand superfamily protein